MTPGTDNQDNGGWAAEGAHGGADATSLETSVQLTADPPAPSRPIALAFTAFVVAAIGGVGAAIVAAIVIAVVIVLQSGDADSIEERMGSDPMLMLATLAPAQLAFLVTAFVFARFRRQPSRVALGWLRPNLSFAAWCAIVVGSGIPFAFSIGAASLPLPSLGGTEGLPDMWADMSMTEAVVWVLFIGLVPGIVEELLFRGLLLRLFLARWSAPAAIIVTSVLFALAHVDPPAMALAFVLGLWLGLVAWRTGSIVPGIVIHATVNASWNLGQIVVRKTQAEETLVWTVVAGIAVVSLVAFVGAMHVLRRSTPPAPNPHAGR
ncbi:MAG: CPBP family intramembrane glutamic endopeptidase [Phycisphaerae bacterium]|nr:CPBP family intramembrane glutamic endopeptidase [Phycisphaerae bacterium]